MKQIEYIQTQVDILEAQKTIISKQFNIATARIQSKIDAMKEALISTEKDAVAKIPDVASNPLQQRIM